jgi:hypothetical protein
VITVSGNPLTDIGLLGEPANITGVWKHGVRVKQIVANQAQSMADSR